MKNGKRLTGLLAAVILAAAGLLWLQHEITMDARQASLIDTLQRDSGRYDAQSIVLRGTNRNAALELAELLGAKLRITADGSYATLTLPEGTTFLDVAADESNRRYLERMSVDYQVQVSDLEQEAPQERLPVDPVFVGEDGAACHQTYLSYVNIGQAWKDYTGAGVTVAIIDTGIDTANWEFRSHLSSRSYNATEDKIVRDYNDWSLIEDEVGHGTAVAGVLTAAMDNGGIVGIAPEAELLVIKAECDANGNFTRSSDLVFALYYAIEQDVQVVNMSFCVDSNEFAEAAQLAYDSDIICVASAGNNGSASPMYPAADKNVIGVGALAAESWKLADYSNYGENTNLVAPGCTYTTALGLTNATLQGTSLAAPQVAGAIALYLQNNEYATFDQVTELLYASCYDLGDKGRDWYYGFGALDIQSFLYGERGTVTFEMLTDTLDDEEALFIRGLPMQEMPQPERPYAVFDGWYYDDTFTQECEYYTDAFTADLTLYAKWVNEDDGIPYTYVVLDDGTVEIRSYTGHRRYITVPEKIDGRVVSSIGDFAFSGQTQLREVILPVGLTNIGAYAFADCANIVTMEIPAKVTTIGAFAFSGDIRLSSLVIPGSSRLKTIGSFAFEDCVKLVKLDLPATLTGFDGSAVYGAASLETITVAAGSSAFKSADGVVFSADGKTLVVYPAAGGSAYEIADGCVSIGDYAFAFGQLTQVDLSGIQTIGQAAFVNAKLETLAIPDSVTAMGTKAFCNNTCLSQVTLGNGLTDLPDECFTGCAKLRQIHIPAGIEAIGVRAFQLTQLSSVTFGENSRLAVIGAGAFAYTQLEQIDIPQPVASIGANAFLKTRLGQVTFASDSVLESIGDSAFAECGFLHEIQLPAQLKTIGRKAFAHSGFWTIRIPELVQDVGFGAFAYCQGMSSIYVYPGNPYYESRSNVLYSEDLSVIHAFPAGMDTTVYNLEDTTRAVESYAFAGTVNLAAVTLNSALEEIHEYAFHQSGIDTIHIPSNVIQISRYSFAACWDMKSVSFAADSKLSRLSFGAFGYTGLKSFTVPANVSSMAQEVFIGSEDLTDVRFAQGSRLESISAYMFKGCGSLKTITFEPGSALTSIQAHGLEGLDRLTAIDFGGAPLTNVDNFAFRFCPSLKELELPDTVTSIGRYAFYCCESLQSLMVPAAVEHIGSYAFLGTGDLELYLRADLLPAALEENWDFGIKSYYVGVQSVHTSGDYRYAVLNSGNTAILEYLGTDTALDLTKLQLSAPIVAIGGSAFEGSSIRSIVLPDTLLEIQAEAFLSSDLESVAIPAKTWFIGRQAFANTPLKNLTFASGSSLSVIEQYAFQKTENLSAVTLPRSLRTMGTGVFLQSGLTSVTFTKGIALEEIPAKAFANTKLTAVSLPDSVTLVDDHAFSGVQTLKSVTFGAGQNIRLMSNAFYQTGLTSLHIPANVTYIGEYCFVALRDLTAFTVDPGNPNYQAVDGLLLNKSGRKLITVPAGRTGSLTVPASVEEIGFGAFEESRLSQVQFRPDANILSLGYRAFFQANNLTEITIPASVVSLDYYAFGYCENLETVRFAGDTRLRGIYEGVFCGCISLRNINLPSGLAEISDYAFYDCSSLEDVPIGDFRELHGIYDYAFAYTRLGGELVLPKSLIDIGSYAFMNTRLEKVTIPDANQRELIIGLGAFEGCGYLEEITVPFIGASLDDEQITWFGYIFGAGSYEANGTFVPESLKTVTVSAGLTRIGTGGFAYCTGLETINLPAGIAELWTDAFKRTTAAYELADPVMVYRGDDMVVSEHHFGTGISGSVRLVSGITEIDSYAFSICCDLQYVEIPDTVQWIHQQAFAGSGLKNVTIPGSVQFISSDAFAGCDDLTSVVMLEGVEYVEEYAFANLPNLHYAEIPSTMKSIDDDAFANCVTLKTIRNNSDLEFEFGSTDHGSIAYYAHTIIDKNGNEIRRDMSELDYVETAEGFRFTIDNGVATLTAYVGDQETITLPQSYNGSPYKISRFQGGVHVNIPEGITTLDAHAFQTNATMKSVTLPKSLTYISKDAFCSCTALEKVTIPSNVKTIGDGAFSYCARLHDLTIEEGVSTIERSAFFSCNSLTEVRIPASVTTLGSGAFSSCGRLVNVVISDDNELYSSVGGIVYNKEHTKILIVPNGISGEVTIADGVTAVGASFEHMDGLTSVIIPGSVKTIHLSAFRGCENLTEVHLDYGVEVISAYAFEGCSSLKSIRLPSSVHTLEENAIPGNVALHLEQPNEAFVWVGGILYDRDRTKILYVPDDIAGEVTVCEGVTELDPYVFKNRTGITSVVLPDTLTSIGEEAFAGCTMLRAISLPDSLTEIKTGAFSGCVRLTEITIPEGVEVIKASAFSYCASLVQVNLPDSLRSINNAAFLGCTGLTSITIPKNVDTIESIAFVDCYKLYEVRNLSDLKLDINDWSNGCAALYANVVIDKDGSRMYRKNTQFEFVETADGFLFAKINGKYQLLEYRGTAPEIVLPETVNGESYDLFYFRGAEKITVPAGVSVPDNAFTGNGTVTSVKLTDTVTALGAESFMDCVDLAEIPLHGGITSIGERAFLNSGLYNNAGSWTSGALFHDGYLLAVREDIRCLEYPDRYITHASDVFSNAHRLLNAVLCPHVSAAANIRTFLVQDLDTPLLDALGRNPNQKKLVVSEQVRSSDIYSNQSYFHDISGQTIYVEASEMDLRWDDNFPGWSGDNVVVYGDDWIWADFYDADGTLLSREPVQNTHIIRRYVVSDYTDDHYTYQFAGWDLDGDGAADSIPAMSAVDIRAVAVYEKTPRVFTVTFMANGTVCRQEQLPYGSVIEAPADLVREGEIFEGWYGYTSGMTVTENMVFFARWHTHSYGEWTVSQAATCTEAGLEQRSCTRCGHYETRAIEAAGHAYESAITEPGCEEQGCTTHTCTRCGHSYTDSYVDATGHSYGPWTVTIAPICTKPGQERRDCENCDHYETRVTDAMGHDYKSVVTAPTCTEKGCTTHTCTRCGHSYTDSYVDATGHSWSEWSVVLEPMPNIPGLKQRTCSSCGKVEQEQIPALDVPYGDTNGDGKVSALDAIFLRQYLAGWDVAVEPGAADANGDGKVNALDAILLRQYLAGWDVTLGSQQ